MTRFLGGEQRWKRYFPLECSIIVCDCWFMSIQTIEFTEWSITNPLFYILVNEIYVLRLTIGLYFVCMCVYLSIYGPAHLSIHFAVAFSVSLTVGLSFSVFSACVYFWIFHPSDLPSIHPSILNYCPLTNFCIHAQLKFPGSAAVHWPCTISDKTHRYKNSFQRCSCQETVCRAF